ncbi:MAG: DUF2339 domain-containing protein, partial [Rhodocyclaceae bacterium]|nr:DUF2339 domain-containing protein [Rhodocyclaceae bacterium]
RLDWQAPQAVTLWLIVVMWFAGVLQFGFVSPAHPAAALGWLAWPLAFAVALVLLRRHEQQQVERAGLFHAALLWLFALLAARECGWQAGRLVPESSAWAAAAWVAVPVALLAALSAWGRRVAWPIAAHEEAYLDLACLPLAVLLPLWAMWANIHYDGAAAPLPYFPFANPLDIALLAALLAPMLWLTVRQGAALAAARAPLRALVAVAAFFVANGILLRSFHHWLPIPYEAAALFASSAVQAGMALLWTVLGCLLMFLATRHGARKLWLCGAALLAATVLKLLLVDLANSGTVARIVAFMGVGLVMLVIGYLAPVPPAQKPGAEPR